MNRRGDVISLIISLVVIFFVIALVAVIISKPLKQTLSTFSQIEGMPESAVEATNFVEAQTIPWLDYLILFSFIAISIGLIISSIYLNVPSAFTIILIILMLVAVVLSGVFSNVMAEVGANSDIVDTYNQFTFTKAIFTSFPIMVFIIGLIVILVLGRNKSEGGVV